jgi:hypothetical protein
MMRSIDRLVVAFLILAVLTISSAFAAFTFFDPIQAAFYEDLPRILGFPWMAIQFSAPVFRACAPPLSVSQLSAWDQYFNLCLGRWACDGGRLAVSSLAPP